MRNEAELEYEQMCAELDHLRECDKANRKLIAELEAQLQVQEQESFGQLKPLRCRVKKLESGLIMIKDDWGECSQIGLCSELGYEMNTWCPYCIAVATLENNNEATIT